MKLYSTCADCGEAMQIYQENQRVHPCCDERPDIIEDAMRAFIEACVDNDEAKANRLADFLRSVEKAPPRLHDAAKIYASWGWPVFPCKPGDKVPATRHGFHDATTEAAQIDAWWKANHRYNIGVATGHAFDVIDIDCDHGPDAIWNWVTIRDHADITGHGWSVTPGGGFHVLIEPTGGGNLTRAGLPGIDFRGLGGYVVVPPSVRSDCDSRRYHWSVKPSPLVKVT